MSEELIERIHVDLINLRNIFGDIESKLNKKAIFNKSGYKYKNIGAVESLITELDEYKKKNLKYDGLEGDIINLGQRYPNICKIQDLMNKIKADF